MKCKKLHKKLIFFLEGDLPEREANEVAIHLDECARCAAFAVELKKTLKIIDQERSPEVNPFFYTRLKARMQEQEEAKRERIGFPVWEKVLQPAFFTLIMLAGIYTGIKIGEPVPRDFTTYTFAENELIPMLNEMEAEPLEAFLME